MFMYRDFELVQGQRCVVKRHPTQNRYTQPKKKERTEDHMIRSLPRLQYSIVVVSDSNNSQNHQHNEHYFHSHLLVRELSCLQQAGSL